MSDPAFIFVYGSLRPGTGHAMSRWLAERGRWLGRGEVAGQLFRVSWYPALVEGEGRVFGDVYRLDAEGLRQLDEFEDIRGLDTDEYERVQTSVLMESGGLVIAQAYWYRLPVEVLMPVKGGDWLAFLAQTTSA